MTVRSGSNKLHFSTYNCVTPESGDELASRSRFSPCQIILGYAHCHVDIVCGVLNCLLCVLSVKLFFAIHCV